MKLLHCFVISLMIFMSCNSPSTSSSASVLTSEDEAALNNLKTVLLPKAYKEQDTALLDQILHEDFELVDDNGDTYSKDYEMEYVANYGPSYSEFEFRIERVDLYDNGTAMISGTGVMKGEDSGGVYITTYKESNTFIKLDGQWQVVNSHVSGVKEETFEDAPSN